MTPGTLISPVVKVDSILTVYRIWPTSRKQALAVSLVFSLAVSGRDIHPPRLFLQDNFSFSRGSRNTIWTGAIRLLIHRTSSPGLTETSAADSLSPIMMSFTSPVLVTVGVLSQPPMNTNINKPIPRYRMELMAVSLLVITG